MTKLMPGKPAMIMFDWDYTLIQRPNITMSQSQIDKLIEYYAVKCNLDKETLEAIAKEESFAAPISLENDSISHMLVKDTEKMLKYFHDTGVPMAIVSNKLHHLVTIEVALAGIQDYFHAVIGRVDTLKCKPHSDMPLVAATKAGVNPKDNIWFIGDARVDTLTALNAGFIAIHSRGGLRGAPATPMTHGITGVVGDGADGAQFVIEGLDELICMHKNTLT